MRSVALAFLSKDFVVNESVVTGSVTGQWAPLVPQNPNRWGLIVALRSGTSAISTQNNQGVTQGIPFPAQVPIIEFNFRDYGGLTQVPWYFQDGSTPILTVIEVLYLPTNQ